jgi:hypothetical protein
VKALGRAAKIVLNKLIAVRVPIGSRFSILHVVQTGSGVHPTSYSMGTGGGGGLYPGVKRTGREADHLTPASAEVKTYTSNPPYVFMA